MKPYIFTAICLILILAPIMLLDHAAAATLVWSFIVAPALLATLIILLTWRLTKKAALLAYIPIFLLFLFTLRTLDLSPVKPFRRFYYSLHPGFTQAEVIRNLEKHFPRNGKYKQPSFSPGNNQIWFVLDRGDGRYNSEIIEVLFENRNVKSTKYFPD